MASSEVPHAGVPPHLARDMTIAEQSDRITGYLRRHAVSRRAALKGGGAALAALALPVTGAGTAGGA